MKSATPSRWVTGLLGGSAALLAMLGFGSIFYFVLEVRGWTSGWGEGVAVAAGLAWMLLVIVAMLRVQKMVERRAQHLASAQADAHNAELRCAAEHLASDPRWSHWAPLIRRWILRDPGVLEGYEQRYRQLLADPKRSVHAAAALDGVFHSDAQIDYLDDPQRLVTCEHLCAIEREIRQQGVRCLLLAERDIATMASMQPDVLRARFALPDFVEWESGWRNPHDWEYEALRCLRCQSSIESRGGEAFPPRAHSAEFGSSSASRAPPAAVFVAPGLSTRGSPRTAPGLSDTRY